MRQMIGFIAGIFILLAIPSAVFAADGPPPVFYVYMDMGDHSDLVRIDTEADMLTKVMSVNTADDWTRQWPFIEWETLPVTPQAFLPAVEWQAFLRDLQEIPYDEQIRVLKDMNVANMNTKLETFWEIRPGLLLLYRRFNQCMTQSVTWQGPSSFYCYGITQFSLFSIETAEERVIWELPFHHKTGGDRGACYTDFVYENFTAHEPVDEVMIHTYRDLIAVQFNSFGGLGCSDALFLIDYSLQIAQVTEFSGVTTIAWSPDGAQLAYIEECPGRAYEPYRREVCMDAFGIIDLNAMYIESFQEFDGYNGWIAWPSLDTLVFSRHDPETYLQSLVWYSISRQEETIVPLPEENRVITALSIRSQDTYTVITNGGNTQVFYPPLAFDETPGVWSTVNHLIVWPVGWYAANGKYAFMGDGQGELSVLDADLNEYPLNDVLENYQQRYGAEAIQLAAFGFQR